MSELQAILARRRQLNNDDGGGSQPSPQPQTPQPKQPDPPTDDGHDGNVAKVDPNKAATRSSLPTQIASTKSAAAKTITFQRPQQESTSSPGASDLHEKLRERRLKAMQMYGKHVKNDFRNVHPNDQEVARGDTPHNHASTTSYTRQPSVPPRKSTFFPRSTPNVAPRKSSGEFSQGQQDLVANSPGRGSDTNVSVERRAGQEADSTIVSVKPTVLPSTRASYNASTPSSPGALPSRKQAQQQQQQQPPPPPKAIDNEPPKSPSMLDLMAERYKEERRKRNQTKEQQPHNPDSTTTPSSSTTTTMQQEKPSTPTYYRPGMRPPSSSSTPSHSGWIPSSPNNGAPPSPVTKLPAATSRFASLTSAPLHKATAFTDTPNDKEQPLSSPLASYINDNDNAPSEASVVDGSVFSESSSTNNIPEFMRMKLKKTVTKRGDVQEDKSVGFGVGNAVESGGGVSKLSGDIVSSQGGGGGVVIAKSNNVVSAKSTGYVVSAKRSGGVITARRDGNKIVEKDATKSEQVVTVPTPPAVRRWRPAAKTNDYAVSPRANDYGTPERNGSTTSGVSWMQQRQQRVLNDAEKHRGVDSFAGVQGRQQLDEEKEEKIYDVPKVKRMNQPKDPLPRGHIALPLSLSEVESTRNEEVDYDSGIDESADRGTDSELSSTFDMEQLKTTLEDTDEIAPEPPNKNSLPPLFANYNTAVLAAKEAIDASNRNRGRNSHKPILPLVETTENEIVMGDPELTMELSPDSSSKDITSFEQDEEMPSVADAIATFDSKECNGFETKEYDFSNDRKEIPMNNVILGSSFVKSSLDMFANSDDEKENKDVGAETSEGQDEFGFDSLPFFGSDPFDPFFDGNAMNDKVDSGRGGGDMGSAHTDKIGQIASFLGATSTEGMLVASWSEESPRFDAEFPDDLNAVNDQEDAAKFDHESSHHKDTVTLESVNEPIPQSQSAVIDESVPQSRNFDSQLEEAGVLAPPHNFVDEMITATVDPSEIFGDEYDTANSQQLQYEEDEGTDNDEIDFDDNFGTFRMHPLEISFGSPSDLHRIPNPIQNPLTDNVIVCRYHCGVFVIEEIDVTQKPSPTTLMSVRVLSNELVTKISRSMDATCHAKVMGVSSVLSLAAGVHRVHGHMRLRVAALMEVVVTTGIAGVKQVRVVAVWKWGYNPGGRVLVSLQSVLSTRDIDDGNSVYDPKTLQVADGLLFLGGHEIFHGTAQPTVFVAKPAVRDGWASVFVGDVSQRGQSTSGNLSVSSLAAINDTNTFLAIGLTDGSVSIWSYDRAVRTNRISTQISGNGRENQSSILQPLCRMKGEIDVASLSNFECLWRSEEISPVAHSSLSKNWSDCTSCLSWIQPCSSGISSLPLLAAAFGSGVAVYHVSTNQIDASISERNEHQKEVTAEPRVPLSYSSVDTIAPLAKAKYSTAKKSASLAKVIWLDLGPRSPPCLSILLNETSTSKLNLCVIDIPWFGSAEIISSKSSLLHRSIGVLSQINLDHMDRDACILSFPRLGAIGCYQTGEMRVYQPTLSTSSTNGGITPPVTSDGYFSSLYRPVSSASLGLNTDGSVYSDTGPNSVKSVFQDTVLTVFSIHTCSKIGANTSRIQNWTIPSQRNWLLISAPGDKPIGSLVQDETDDNFDISYRRNAERSGARSSVICELTCGENPVSGLIPERIVREDGGRRVAVLFSPSYFGNNATDASSRTRRRTHTRVSADPVAYAILDIDEIMKNRTSSSFTLRHARDVAFLPTSQMEGGFYCSSLVVLDSDGSGLSITTVISSRSQKDGVTEKVIESEEKCLLNYEGIDGRRVFTLLNGDHPQILLAGESTVVGRPCLIVAKHELERDTYSNTFALLEADSLGHRLWLKTGEMVISVRELPKHPDAVHAHIAIATQQRVMIVSAEDSLSVVAEVSAYLTSPSLSPLGSHCVAFSAAPTPFCGGESSIRYLSCLQSVYGHGVITFLPSQRNGPKNLLLTAIRPDRLVYFVSHGGVRLTDEDDEAEDKFDIPIPTSRPILLLEALLANALCQDRTCGANASKTKMVQQSLHLVIEKFGRKPSSFPHGDNEGIGSVGVGITSKAYQMLVQHKCHQAASLLLCGNGQKMTIQTRVISPSISIMSTIVTESDTELSVSHKPNCPSVMHAENLAYSVAEQESFNAIRTLNFANSQQSEDILRQLVLALNAKSFAGARSLLFEMYNTENCRSLEDFATNHGNLLSVVTRRLASSAGEGGQVNVSLLAPEAQRSWSDRSRYRMLNTDVLEIALNEKKTDMIPNYSIKEGRHVWCAGPFGRPEKLFRLESFEDWFGRCLLTILGNDGVALAAGTGEHALANILSSAALEETAEQPTGLFDHDHDGTVNRRKQWVEGIGEEHLDEDNLSLYTRFSEGADEDNKWKLDGFSDLSNHGHKLYLYGSEFATLEATTSSVDEGEQGKVQLLYDLVFNDGPPRDTPTGIFVHVARGGSLDVGMLHTPKHKARQKATIEFWYHLPQSHLLNDEIILARRSLFYEDSGDASNVCLPDEKHNTLWELALLPTGFLELRTGAGSVVLTASSLDGNQENASNGVVSWKRCDGGGGWNHVCLLFSAQSESSPTEFSATILMNGVKVVSSVSMFVNPLEAKLLRDINEVDLEDAMERSVLAFGIGPCVGFRITDIRVWACLRDEDDIKSMMYEYLRHAEMKKKLKINIRKGPKKSVLPAPPTLPLSQADTRRSAHTNTLYNPSEGNEETVLSSDRGFLPDFANFDGSESNEHSISHTHDQVGESVSSSNPAVLFIYNEKRSTTDHRKTHPPGEPSFVVTMSDLLSTKVRKSASTAIIRGPPAARHFGGNRGGLLCTHKRRGVGPIAICGSDKSIVFYHDLDPPAKTYPIGASGAILSDTIDETQSEYMCCFLAKEKRVIVFELALKAVVVELQMKTKLNFWRFLPPEADGGVLVFMLITPIGGFHWKPLDDSPRPRQVWKRGPDLESKKILAYEEGGGCGRDKSARSTVALVLASEATSGAAVVAYCISMDNESSRLCIAPNVLGAALYHHPVPVRGRFLPYVVYVIEDEACQFHLNVQEMFEDNNTSYDVTLLLGDVKSSVILDVNENSFDAPPLSMGSSPEVLCCCHGSIIVAIMRKQGLIFAYNFTSADLSLVARIMLDHYVIDAAIRSGNADNEVELVVLLCHNDSKDGRVAVVTITDE